MMGDIQEYFTENNVKNFYSVSISVTISTGAGAAIRSHSLRLRWRMRSCTWGLSGQRNGYQQLCSESVVLFSNAWILSAAGSVGLPGDIWAVAVKRRYSGSERSQMLKYHIQTSGRSLHSQDIQFNDIKGRHCRRFVLFMITATACTQTLLMKQCHHAGPPSLRRALASQPIITGSGAC